jgi:hypothetical protein
MIRVEVILALQGEHGVRRYANVVGASDPARKRRKPARCCCSGKKVHGLGQDNSMFALARTANECKQNLGSSLTSKGA